MADDFLIDGNENYFTEKILTLKNAFAFTPNEKMIQAKKNLRKFPHKNFTFGSLNNFMKISDEYLYCVKKILDEVPNSKIIFRDTTPLESRKKVLEEKILSAGIKNFEVRTGEDNFFGDYSEIDLILDTFPYTGGMMTALAVYFEVPVINLCGEKFHSRIGADILKICELENFIVKNKSDYIKKAVEFSKNPAVKFDLKNLLDGKSFAEDFYEKILTVKLELFHGRFINF